MGEIKLLVVDNNPAVLDGLCSIIAAQPDMEVAGAARNVLDATDIAARLQPDVILMDASLPAAGSIEATRWIKKNIPRTNVLVLTVHPSYMEESFAAGADGYLMKDCPRTELLGTIREIMAKRTAACRRYYSNERVEREK